MMRFCILSALEVLAVGAWQHVSPLRQDAHREPLNSPVPLLGAVSSTSDPQVRIMVSSVLAIWHPCCMPEDSHLSSYASRDLSHR